MWSRQYDSPCQKQQTLFMFKKIRQFFIWKASFKRKIFTLFWRKKIEHSDTLEVLHSYIFLSLNIMITPSLLENALRICLLTACFICVLSLFWKLNSSPKQICTRFFIPAIGFEQKLIFIFVNLQIQKIKKSGVWYARITIFHNLV